jgi:hypothetical protein
MAQVPPPPQAEGRKMPWPESVDSNDEPGWTSRLLSSLMVIFTIPPGVSFFLANNSIHTRRRRMTRKTTMLAKTTIPVLILYLLNKDDL